MIELSVKPVEGYPHDVGGLAVSRSPLSNATVGLLEQEGFERKRRLGSRR